MKSLPEAEQESYREWYRDRFDDRTTEERKAKHMHEGITGMIHLELLHDSLWAIMFTPDSDFMHLKNEHGLKRALAEDNRYHISICFNSDIDKMWKWRALEHLQKLYDKPVRHTFKISYFTSGLTAEIMPTDEVYKEIKDLHTYGSYHYKQIHMSL